MSEQTEKFARSRLSERGKRRFPRKRLCQHDAGRHHRHIRGFTADFVRAVRRRAVKTSSSVVRLACNVSPIARAARSGVNRLILAPPRGPRRTSIRSSPSNSRMASRSVGRETENTSISWASVGRLSSCVRSPRTIAFRIWSATCSAARLLLVYSELAGGFPAGAVGTRCQAVKFRRRFCRSARRFPGSGMRRPARPGEKPCG